MRLDHLATVRADLKTPIEVDAVPSGVRQIFDVTGGRFEGPGLSGSVLASGGDWLLIGNDGVGRLDVRATLETDDSRYAWLNRVVAVGQGRVLPNAVEYRISRVLNDE